MKGGPAVHVFEREYEARFGITPVIGTPDAVQLNRALKIAGEAYADLVKFYLNREDAFMERHGYSGRLLTAAVINAWKLATAKKRPVATVRPDGESYKEKLARWQEENGLAELPSLAKLPGGE